MTLQTSYSRRARGLCFIKLHSSKYTLNFTHQGTLHKLLALCKAARLIWALTGSSDIHILLGVSENLKHYNGTGTVL